MAYDKEIRFKCRALCEVMNMTLKDISTQESVAIGTLSYWKNDDRPEYGGIWEQGSKSSKIKEVSKKLGEELKLTSIYDEMKSKVSEYNIIKDDKLQINSIAIDNQELQAEAEAETALLGSVGVSWFDSKLLRNALYSTSLIERKAKKDPDSVKQTELKTSSEIVKIAKESIYGKDADTNINIFNKNSTSYTKEQLEELTIEEIEQLYKKEQENINNNEISLK